MRFVAFIVGLALAGSGLGHETVDEITVYSRSDYHGRAGQNETDVMSEIIIQRDSTGTGLACDQWNGEEKKKCYCNGAMVGRDDVFRGFDAFCDKISVDKDGPGVKGNTFAEYVNWLPTQKIEYRIHNTCGDTYTVKRDDCGTNFVRLVDWCEWTWLTHKGGWYDVSSCIRFEYDANAR